MLELDFLSIAATLLCLCSTFFAFQTFVSKRGSTLPLPPGPRGAFIVGNAFQIPRTEPWVWCGDLKGQYGAQCSVVSVVWYLTMWSMAAGDVVHLSIFGLLHDKVRVQRHGFLPQMLVPYPSMCAPRFAVRHKRGGAINAHAVSPPRMYFISQSAHWRRGAGWRRTFRRP